LKKFTTPVEAEELLWLMGSAIAHIQLYGLENCVRPEDG
jgi:hypothetical protein